LSAPDDPVGRFVVDVKNPVGFGWCDSVQDSVARVTYIDLPEVAVETMSVALADLKAVSLPEEMRVWLRNRFFGWWPGRIQGQLPSGDYLVKLASLKEPIPAPADSLHVRWDQPLAASDVAVAIGMTDSPIYYYARRPVIRNLIEQRAACRGFTSILSAAVRPYQHQLGVLTRVLGDPIMRFVLADEVGLGKTIEAGLIIRQLFLDEPTSQVLVAVPRTLVGQWTDELGSKLLLDHELEEGSLRVVDHDDLSLVRPYQPSMLVIDEAHRVVEQAMSDPDEHEILQNAALACPSLLLLTATPLRGNAAMFLGLLHLIDPDVYRLDDVDGFRRRLELREQQASAIELLSPDVPPTAVRDVLKQFSSEYPTDTQLQKILQQAEMALSGESGDPAPALKRAASHLRETYRISRRVIRNRRSSVVAEGFPVSGRHLSLIEFDDPCREVVDEFLEQWRRILSDRAFAPGVGHLFAKGAEICLAGPRALLAFIEDRLSRIPNHDADRSLSPTQILSPTEIALLRQTRATIHVKGMDARLQTVTGHLQESVSENHKSVVFCSFPEVAQELTSQLIELFGRRLVAAHLGSMTNEQQDEAVGRFIRDGDCRVMVCDRSGEEGRNLQVATQIIHLDLPLSINRLEQRIGRTDRFNEAGLRSGVPSVVIAEPQSPWVTNHLELLNHGIGVFTESVATLQRPLADLEAEVVERLINEGSSGFLLDMEKLRMTLDDERNQIELLEELEGTLTATEFSGAAFDDLLEFDEQWGDTADAFDALISEDGGIRLQRVAEPNAPGVFSFTVDPRLRTIPLMPMHQLKQVGPLLRGRRSFNRATARRHAGVRLVRLGDPLVDWISEYVRIDERGRARALWRHVPGFSGPAAWFGFDFLIEFDAAYLHQYQEAVRRRLRRRGDTFLAPILETVWTDGEKEAAPATIDQLLDAESIAGGGDAPLRGPRWSQVLEAFPDWTERCQQAGEFARLVLDRRASVNESIASAMDHAEAEIEHRLRVLRTRAERMSPSTERDRALEETEIEEALGKAVVAGLVEPCRLMVAAGAVILAGSPLE
jgi:ATP-dependent helicase HepA